MEFTQEYGLPGQGQEGIDIYVRRRSSSRYAVWQCKRYQEAGAHLIRDAVDEFLAGEWAAKSDEFVLCISATIAECNIADEIERQRDRLTAKNITFTPLGIVQLSERLKDHPDLVHDFFGLQAVKDFCGEEAVAKLSRRKLTPEGVSQLRLLLRRCYSHHFDSVDPGLPSLTSAMTRGPTPLPLYERFVIPDVLEPRQFTQTQLVTSPPTASSAAAPTGATAETTGASNAGRMVTVTSDVRRGALNWLVEGQLSVVIGDPGIGKSSLLRYVLLDLLSAAPRHEQLALKWGNRLPVWVPFAMWTRMVAETENGCSLADVLAGWLSKVSASAGLKTLVQQALDDSRLLLFVDGLDEWSDEVAAGTTVALLEQFVGEREVPAVATSRPLGFEKLGGLSGNWRRAKLAGLTIGQQREFSAHWFLHKARQLRTSAADDEDAELRDGARREAAGFIEELQRENQLARLGEIPLLLSGLIALSAQSVRLPRNRFKAYQELTRLLLQEQPQRRERAAHARTSTSRISQETRERALARLAFAIHQSPGSDSIEKGAAEETLRGFLAEQLKKNDSDALELAKKILAVGAETIGILVEKSPTEIGFPHRAFQEFLVAHYLKDLRFDEQKKVFRDFFGNPQWHDALLCLCHLNTRAGEVDSFVEDVRTVILPLELEAMRHKFLGEIAFDDLNCSAACASQIAHQLFVEIETGPTMPLRENLLDRALDGLFSDTLRQDFEARVQKWYPDRFGYRSSVYAAMASWPREPETTEALWRGLLDDEEANQRAAAEAIAQATGGDDNIRERLLHLILTPIEARITAYALHSLCTGWPEEPKLPSLLKSARDSAEPLLRIISLCHRVRRREQDSDDRKMLLQFANNRPMSSYHWKSDSISALLEGWPRDLDLKQSALKTLATRFRWESPMSPESAGQILLEGFPQDNAIAEAIAKLFREEDYPQHRLGINFDWQPLVCAFGGHPLLAEAVDDWRERKGNRFWDCELCLLSKSERARDYLCKTNDKTGVINEDQARWLLRGWGMSDPLAAKALGALVESDQVKQVLHLLPAIMEDKEACRKRLMVTCGMTRSTLCT